MMQQDHTWQEFSDRLEALGLKLKLHFEQSRDGDLAGTMRTLRERVQEAFDATSSAVDDEAVRADVREVGRLLADELANTLDRMGRDVRDTLGHRHRP
jgi:hypothetical protein